MSVPAKHELGRGLIHENAGGQGAHAGIRHVGDFKQALHTPVFTGQAVEGE